MAQTQWKLKERDLLVSMQNHLMENKTTRCLKTSFRSVVIISEIKTIYSFQCLELVDSLVLNINKKTFIFYWYSPKCYAPTLKFDRVSHKTLIWVFSLLNVWICTHGALHCPWNTFENHRLNVVHCRFNSSSLEFQINIALSKNYFWSFNGRDTNLLLRGKLSTI